MVFPGQGLEGGERPGDLVCGHAIGEADIAGGSEAVRRNQKKLVLPGMSAEGLGIRLRCFHKEVEGTIRMNAGEAIGGQRLVEQVSVFW